MKKERNWKGLYYKLYGPFLHHPEKPRWGEHIGGGWVIFRRTTFAKRLKTVRWVFEHPSESAARIELARLRKEFPEKTFELWERK